MNIEFDILQSLGIAIIAYIIGLKLKNRSQFLRKFFIPSPVIGGIIVSIIVFNLKQFLGFEFTFDGILQDFFMNIFFACIGLACSFAMLKKAGSLGLKLALAIIVLLPLQNIIAIALSKVFGLNPLLGVAMGSTSMTGGIGSAVSFGKIMEDFGAANAIEIGVAASTFGLLAGSLVGGPTANRLINKYKLVARDSKKSGEILKDKREINQQSLMYAVVVIALAGFLGTFINKLLALTGLNFPYYVGCQFGGLIVRNICDRLGIRLNMNEVDIIGNIALTLFLSLALISLDISAILALALPMLVIMLGQAAFISLYTSLVTFRLTGKNYDAAVMVAGHCGVGLGQTPNAMANMEAVIEARGDSQVAMFVFPIVLAIAVNFFNPVVITFFINMYK